MKKTIPIIVIIILFVIGGYFLFKGKNSISNKQLTLKEEQVKYSKYSKINTTNTGNNNIDGKIVKNGLPTPKEAENNKKKSEKILYIMENKGYKNQIDSYLKAICGNKKTAEEVTCSVEYRFFVPRLFGFLVDMKKNEKLEYKDIENILYAGILRNCKNLDDDAIELVGRGIKENDTTCSKEVAKMYKNYYQKLNNDSLYSLDVNKFYKPISVYYSIPGDLTDTYQVKLQLLILKKYDNLLKKEGIQKEKFQEKLLNSVGAYTIENLKQNIVKEYIKLFNKYKLDNCGLKLTGYSNYFVWVPVENKAIECIKKKGLDKSLIKDYNKLDNMISIFSYLTKVFPTEKAQAKAIFGENGVGIANLVDIISFLKN